MNSETEISPWREVKINFTLFPQWEQFKEGDYDTAREYVHGTYQDYIRRHYKKRVAKKIIEHGKSLRGRIFREYRYLTLQLVALSFFKKFMKESQEPGFAQKILPVELIENSPPDNPG